MTNTKDAVINMIAEQMGIPAEGIKPEERFVDDLGADSLHVVELIMGLEEEFEIEIDDEDFDQLVTVQQIIDFILES
jgi:acyl carrier protein